MTNRIQKFRSWAPLVEGRDGAPSPSACSLDAARLLSVTASRTIEFPLIYAVDDVPEITELYIAFLEVTGCSVKAFNDRAEALAALEADHRKPALLITDYFGLSMPVDRFLERCRLACPALRILVASGFDQIEAGLSQAHRYLQKPFTPEAFRQEVMAALAA